MPYDLLHEAMIIKESLIEEEIKRKAEIDRLGWWLMINHQLEKKSRYKNPHDLQPFSWEKDTKKMSKEEMKEKIVLANKRAEERKMRDLSKQQN